MTMPTYPIIVRVLATNPGPLTLRQVAHEARIDPTSEHLLAIRDIMYELVDVDAVTAHTNKIFELNLD